MGNCESGSCSTSKDKCCSTKSSSSKCAPSSCEMTDGMMKLAERAWEEAMVEKMKKLWIEQRGEHMDKMAEAAVALNSTHWKNKMQSMSEMMHAKEELRKTFMQ